MSFKYPFNLNPVYCSTSFIFRRFLYHLFCLSNLFCIENDFIVRKSVWGRSERKLKSLMSQMLLTLCCLGLWVDGGCLLVVPPSPPPPFLSLSLPLSRPTMVYSRPFAMLQPPPFSFSLRTNLSCLPLHLVSVFACDSRSCACTQQLRASCPKSCEWIARRIFPLCIPWP